MIVAVLIDSAFSSIPTNLLIFSSKLIISRHILVAVCMCACLHLQYSFALSLHFSNSNCGSVFFFVASSSFHLKCSMVMRIRQHKQQMKIIHTFVQILMNKQRASLDCFFRRRFVHHITNHPVQLNQNSIEWSLACVFY